MTQKKNLLYKKKRAKNSIVTDTNTRIHIYTPNIHPSTFTLWKQIKKNCCNFSSISSKKKKKKRKHIAKKSREEKKIST